MSDARCGCGRQHFTTRANARRRAEEYRRTHPGRYITQACPWRPGEWTFGSALRKARPHIRYAA